ncbi:hypothetical protein HWV62_29865 [Athelia sp. TMB]|nr:hypothetical protein HWV62_29865 [Athelia sp. TMB]
MPKPSGGAVASKRLPKPVIARTMITRTANANTNPMDLEVPSDEEVLPRKQTKKRKKVVKTQEEVDAIDEQRDGVLAAVSHLEDDMQSQAMMQDGTPRVVSTVKSISRADSYVAPDPPAYSKTIFSSEDDAPQPISKKFKVSTHVDSFESKAKQAAPKQRNTKQQLTVDLNDLDENMNVDSDDEETATPPAKKPRSSAGVENAKLKAKQAALKRQGTKASKDDKKMDIDSDDEEATFPAKKSRPLREIIDSIKAERWADKERSMRAEQQSENMDVDVDDDSPAAQDLFESTDEDEPPAPVLAPATKKRLVPLRELFADSATVIKREKFVAPVEDASDSDIEIVEENLNPKPRPTKSQSKSKGKVAMKPDRYVFSHPPLSSPTMLTLDRTTLFFFSLSDSYKAIESSEEQSAFINDWQDKIVETKPKGAAGKRGGGASKATTPALTSGTSKRSQCSKAPSSSRTASSNQVKIKNYDDYTIDDSDGLLSEKDERFGGERLLAVKSPHKGKGRRATSSALVKVKESNSSQRLTVPLVVSASNAKPSSSRSEFNTGPSSSHSVTTTSEELDVKPFSVTLLKKPSGKVTNKDLPDGYLANGAWCIVTLSFFRFIATTMEVFNVTESTMIFALTILSSVIYGPTGISLIAITPSSVPFRLALQRLSDSWRTIIGSAAIAALTAFFDSNPKFNSDQRRMKFARRLYEFQRYLYKHAEGEDKNRFKGLFHGSFVISTFAAHLNIVSGSQEVLELYAPQGITTKEGIPKARGALALCGVAVMRAVALYATGGITLSSLKDEKASANKRLTFPAFIPPISKTEIRDKTTRSSAFSASSWAAPTAYLVKACNRSITDEDMDSIVKEAKEIVRASRRQAREADSDLDPDNSLLQLGNGSSSDGEDDMDIAVVDDSEPEDEVDEEDEGDNDASSEAE